MRIAIIPARGGSKRIPLKNIREFCGRPIISYSIEAAIESDVFDEVMVSTDSEEIAQIARKYGASIPFFRSKESANDFATIADVINEVLYEYEKRGKTFDEVCCIYATAPFITAERLKSAMRVLEKEDADSVLPVTEFSFPPMRGMNIRDGRIAYAFPEFAMTRSQDIPSMYHDCGQFTACKVNSFRRYGKNVCGNVYPVMVSELETQDIDTEIDWKLAELKYKLIHEKEA